MAKPEMVTIEVGPERKRFEVPKALAIAAQREGLEVKIGKSGELEWVPVERAS